MEEQPNIRLERLRNAGVSIWLDTLSRELLQRGDFAELVRDYAVTGATSNPTIFAKAITGSDRYDADLRALVAAGARDPRKLFLTLALDDVGRAADGEWNDDLDRAVRIRLRRNDARGDGQKNSEN